MKKSGLAILLTATLGANAQTEIKDFSLTNVKDGKTVSLSQYKSAAGIAVVFTSHECPFDNYYKDRLKELVSSYSGRIQFLFINANQEAEENAAQMAIHYSDLPIPYLADKEQKAMETFGARKSPEVFLLNTSGGKFTVAYSGAIDDNPQTATDVKQSFLKEAIEKLLAGQKTEIAVQRAVGCTIRRK
ncbi:MAG: redoxin domain-containing protein [Cyclobacteriaceae bacterium]|nr:redoxin domain-containing protein [Cyclobacteriaceae bacterium]